jgi:pilus assembly protein FimV
MVLGFGFNKAKVLASAEKYVQQGKLQAAIGEYEKVIREDARDLTVLNTIGDLYARLGQMDHAAEFFRKVGDAYASDGFTVKAIAMYKKLAKLNPSATECIHKLADLYTQQGLYNDARVHYMQVGEHYLRSNHKEAAVKVFQKILDLDPENSQVQSKLGELLLALGRKDDARNLFFRAAETMYSRNLFKNADEALARVLKLEPGNERALQLRGQIALDGGDPQAAIKFLEEVPDIDSRPEALRALLKAFIGANHLSDAEPLARKLLTVHNDTGGITTYAEALVNSGASAQVVNLFNEYADRLLVADSDKMIQVLSMCISRAKDDATALEVLRSLFKRAGDTAHGGEVSELLAHASVQAGDLARARDLYYELSQQESENPLHAQNYKQIVAKLGEDTVTRDLAPAQGEQAFMVEELENAQSDVQQIYANDLREAIQAALTDAELFDSYNLPLKAIGPLEEVAKRAPYDAQVNRRLVALYSRTSRMAEAAHCCAILEKVYSLVGNSEQSRHFAEATQTYASSANIPLPLVKLTEEQACLKVPSTEMAEVPATSEVVPSAHVETSFVQDFVVTAPTAFEADAPAPPAFLDQQAQAPVGSINEVDLSEEWEQMLVSQLPEEPVQAQIEHPAPEPEPVSEVARESIEAPVEAVAEPETAGSQLQDAVDEIGFYLGQSMWKEAEAAILRAEAAFPGVPKLEVLKGKLAHLKELDLPEAEEVAEIVEVEPEEQESQVVDEPPEVALQAMSPEPPVEAIADPTSEPVSSPDFDDFASDLDQALGADFTFAGSPVPPAIPVMAPEAPVIAAVSASAPVHETLPQVHAAAATATAVALAPEVGNETFSPLSDLFEEFKEEVEGAAAPQEDPETHYNLGMAFKEMGLLDEAIGELQKVCQAVDRGAAFAQTMQAYTWLANCFIEKGVPQAAFKWYERALKLPGDEETRTAIHYELASAYEKAGNRESALNHFLEVYGSNIDYRDVAERIKTLKP